MAEKKLTVYWYPKCSTCRNAVAWLHKRKQDLTLIDMVQTPPSKSLLKDLLKRSGFALLRFFNTSGKLYREFKLANKLPNMTEDDALALLSQHGKLIKRPLVFSHNKITLGFKAAEFTNIWLADRA